MKKIQLTAVTCVLLNLNMLSAFAQEGTLSNEQLNRQTQAQALQLQQAQALQLQQAQLLLQQNQQSNGSSQLNQATQVAQTPQTSENQPSVPPSNLPPLPSDFDLAVQQSGLSPKEIQTLHKVLDQRQKSSLAIPNPPKSVTGSISVSLDPGSVPPVIRPFYGVATSLVILDSTGSPWPVENFTIGNRSLFQVERLDGDKGSSFVIAPIQPYGQSNLVLKLLGHPTPVIINLVSGQKVVDSRIEARILGRGPNAIVNSVALTQGVDSRLLSVLDGVPPSGRALTIKGDQTSKAWVMPDGNIWLRTSLNVVSPAPLSFVSSSDGTKVYKLTPSAKILGMSNGNFLTLDISGCLQECGTTSW